MVGVVIGVPFRIGIVAPAAVPVRVIVPADRDRRANVGAVGDVAIGEPRAGIAARLWSWREPVGAARIGLTCVPTEVQPAACRKKPDLARFFSSAALAHARVARVETAIVFVVVAIITALFRVINLTIAARLGGAAAERAHLAFVAPVT